MLHPLWLKQYTHDYDGIIYLSLSVTVQRFQLRSFSLFCLPQAVLDLENFLDLKTEKPASKCFQIYSLTSHYQYYNFRPKHNTLAMLNGLLIENGWETHTFLSLFRMFSAPSIWENRPEWVYIIPIANNVTHISGILKWNVMQSIYWIFLALGQSPKPKQSW